MMPQDCGLARKFNYSMLKDSERDTMGFSLLVRGFSLECCILNADGMIPRVDENCRNGEKSVGLKRSRNHHSVWTAIHIIQADLLFRAASRALAIVDGMTVHER